MEIVRNSDGTLIVPVEPGRQHGDDADTGVGDDAVKSQSAPTTRVLHPGEGGYDEALGEWDRQQNPDADVPVSTASGREEAMSVVHAVAELRMRIACAVPDGRRAGVRPRASRADR